MIYILKRPTTAAGATIASLREGSFSEMRSALNLSERQSTLTLTVDDTAPEIAVGAWLEDGTAPGKGIVWRVKSVDTDYATGIRTIQCEHLIRILKDSVMFGEVTPADIAGKKSAKECTAKATAQHILKSSPAWTLGSFEFSHSAPYSFNGEDLLSALETVSGSLLDAWWTYDFGSYPFKLNVTKKSDDVISEMRMSRNIRTLKKTIDMSRMYTRFYPIGKNNLKLSGGGYVEKNVKLYGVVSKVETDSEKDTADKLRAWANERLALHAEPSVTVTISGMELADATGEPLDRLTLGRICRVPLPEYGTIITERITRLSYGDKIADPEAVTVTLANAQEDVASIISQMQKSASRGGRAGAKKEEEDHAWIDDTTDHVRLVAEAVAGPGAAKDWSRVSTLGVDKDGISGRVKKTEGDMVTAQADIKANEKAISLEVKKRTAKDEWLDGKIETTAGKVSMVVTERNGKNIIKAAEIVVAINDDKSTESRIKADKVYIGDQKSTTVINGKLNASDVTAEYLNAKIATIPTLTGIAARFSGNVRGAGGMFGQVYVGSGSDWTNISDGIAKVKISGPTGNEYTLQYKKFSDSEWQDAGNFSRAVASWTMGWSGGTFTAKAKPQNQSCSTQIVQGATSWDGDNATVPIEAIDSDNPGYQYATGRSILVNASARYRAGLKDYHDSEFWKSPLSNSGVCQRPNATNDDYETWFTMSRMGITRAVAYKSPAGVVSYYGKLYYYDAAAGVYRTASDSDHYWYYSSVNRSGSVTVYY